MAETVHVECDTCLAAGTHTDGESHKVLLDDHGPMRIDLCDDHLAAFIGPLREQLEKHGLRWANVRPARGPYNRRPARTGALAPIICFWCDATFTTTSGLGGHLVRKHGADSTGNGGSPGVAFAELYGRTCPWCGERELPGGTTGLSQHLKLVHPDAPTGWVETYTAAYRAGDPQGVVAELKRVSPLT